MLGTGNRIVIFSLCVISALLVSGCAGSGDATAGSSSSGSPAKPKLEQGAPPVYQKTVGRVELAAPAPLEFAIRATLPIPPGTYPADGGLRSFAFIGHDGGLIPSQVEIVSRYPKDGDGADIVEILSRVSRSPESSPGDRIRFDIAEVFYEPGAAPSGSTIPELLADGMLPETLVKAITPPAAIHFRARDAFGNLYSMDPLHPDGGWVVKRLGHHAITVRGAGTMKPTGVKSPEGDPLPQLFAVHAYLTGWAEENLLSLDARFHNGWIGPNPLTPSPISDCYFQSLEILVPKGWAVYQDFADANLGSPYDTGAFTAFPLVKPNADGTMHLIPQQSQHERRLVIAPAGSEAKAKHFLQEQGLAFSQPGAAEDGTPFYSWWNPQTARYFAQKSPLPTLDFASSAGMRAKHATDLANLATAVASGVALPSGDAYKCGAQGIANPALNQYGGVTGGSWITALSGTTIAWAASREGYQLEQLRHRMNADRQAVALFKENGEPASVEDFLKTTSGGMKYVPFEFEHAPLGSTGKAFFGLNAPPNPQAQKVASFGLKPAYEAALLEYQPHDMQHLIRYTRGPKILATLGNDPMAKDDLKLEAELFRISYGQYPHNSSGSFKKNSMLGHKDFVTKHPNKGVEYHRGEAWGTDVAAMAYAMGDEAHRSKALPWFQALADVVRDGQAGCGRGSVMALFNAGKIFDAYRGLQTYEECFVENALRGTLKSVLEGKDPARQAQMEAVLEGTYRSLVSEDSWPEPNMAPHTKLAVGPSDPLLPIFCAGEIPADGKSTDFEKEEIWIGLSGGLELTGDPIFFQKAQTLAGGTLAKLKTALETSDDSKLANSGWMLAKMQQLGWSAQP